ncbi:MAG: MmgE/PrpD family protein [Candidatus Helarchaeota archaeon]
MVTLSQELAKFIIKTNYDNIPKRVHELAKDQLMGVLGTMYAGSKVKGCEIIKKTAIEDLSSPNGIYTIIPSGEKVTLKEAIMVNQANAIALDYDDYLSFAHTGVSTVPLPLTLSEYTKITGKELLTAIIIGNEVSGRVGASILIGPQNGQLWSYVHLSSACAIVSKILGLNEEQIANAFGIAMYISTVAMYRGFMGPMSKLLTSSIPSKIGLEAAFLAKNGFTGALDIFESPLGWCNFTADVPIPSFINSALGEAWVTDTISFKMVPGCAYVSPIADCLNKIFEKAPNLDYKEIKEINVHASLLMAAMDDLSRPFINLEELKRTQSHIALNFYIPYNVAVMIIDKELTPKQLEESRILDPEVHELAKKVKTISDLGSTGDTLSLVTSLELETDDDELKAGFNKDRMEKLDMSFGARMVIKMNNGKKYSARVKSPSGSPGNRVPIEPKLKQEASYIGMNEVQIKEIIELIRNIEKIQDVGKEIIPKLCLR